MTCFPKNKQPKRKLLTIAERNRRISEGLRLAWAKKKGKTSNG